MDRINQNCASVVNFNAFYKSLFIFQEYVCGLTVFQDVSGLAISGLQIFKK
jgi:hypothetical protein